jgi:2-hydroxychromene-2-carboxylate isomerase
MFDLARKARMLGVPIGPPKSHPFNPLLLLRTASVPMEPAARRQLIDRLYAAVWSGEARDIEDRATVVALATEAGLDGEQVVAAAESPEGKARVRTQTARLVEAGAFGVPWIICDGEPFWGVDSLRELEAFLERGAPSVDAESIARWSAIRPSAERRQR